MHIPSANLRLSERNTKGKQVFLLISERKGLRLCRLNEMMNFDEVKFAIK